MRFTRLLQVLLAAGALLGLVHVVVYQFSEKGDRLYKFFYERGPVQHAILFVACLVTALLFERINRHRWNSGHFKALERGQGQAPKELADQLEVVSATYGKHGPSAAVVRAEKVAQDHAKETHKAYESIGFVTGFLPALGLVGTMLGLSDALFSAFSSGGLEEKSVMTFVTALSTAMDTTVLAMLCAVPLFAAAFLLGKLENDLGDRYAALVLSQLGLEDAVVGDKTADALQAELRRMMTKIGKDAKAAFGQIVVDSVETYRENLERIVAEVFSRQRRHDKDMVRKVAAGLADGLGQSVNRVGDLIERQNGRLAEDMISQVGQLEEALRKRTPEEVLIRYQNNGHTK